ncbi:MAG TPA: type II and III secretion system protein family protein [Syntrophales bacterium]|nr:type II and III secretion system protein family protein [Syntrophales bacterium]HQL90629.1 type II and III secretion system protein family protein [Syntrophales bacterium]
MKIRPKMHTTAGAVLGLLLLFAFIAPQLCAAAGPSAVTVNNLPTKKISLSVGKSTVVDSADPIKRVSVAAPEIADTVVLSARQIYVTAKSSGLTTITLWSDANRVSAVFDVEVLPDVAALKEKIHQVFPNEKDIKVLGTHDSITLSGTVSSAGNLTQIVRLAEAYAPLDKQSGKPKLLNLVDVGGVHQVMLEVRVAEMSRSLLRRLGVNFSYLSDSGTNFGISLLNNLTRLPSAGWPGNPLTVGDNINWAFRFTGAGATWTGFIDALKENGLTKVLAEPTLITLSGRSASFLAGGEFPIPVPQATGGSTTITIEYKTFGVGLNFTPTVLSNGKISMAVNPEVSDLDFTRAVAVQGFLIPSVNTRRVSTVIELGDGQSFAVAGLLKDDVREDVKKFPVLGDIPVLGALFRSTSFQKNETELIVIVTPHLVKPLDMAKQTLPTDAFIEPDDFEFYLLGATEGREKKTAAKSPAASVPGLKKGSGLEGDFGYMKP